MAALIAPPAPPEASASYEGSHMPKTVTLDEGIPRYEVVREGSQAVTVLTGYQERQGEIHIKSPLTRRYAITGAEPERVELPEDLIHCGSREDDAWKVTID